ncbi:MAG: TIGR03905 family TSCPD domain-containing protein [bacterium]
MEKKVFKTAGVCAREITFDYENGCIYNVAFAGGCNGNLKAIATLIDGKELTDVQNLLKGNTCNARPTSCGDQLAKAIGEVL